jgi:hypothetical protein
MPSVSLSRSFACLVMGAFLTLLFLPQSVHLYLLHHSSSSHVDSLLLFKQLPFQPSLSTPTCGSCFSPVTIPSPPLSSIRFPLSDEEKKPLKLSRQLASLTCGIFFPTSATSTGSHHLILLDPSTFEGDYNDCTRQLTQREAVLDHLLTLVTDTEGNITFLSQV